MDEALLTVKTVLLRLNSYLIISRESYLLKSNWTRGVFQKKKKIIMKVEEIIEQMQLLKLLKLRDYLLCFVLIIKICSLNRICINKLSMILASKMERGKQYVHYSGRRLV